MVTQEELRFLDYWKNRREKESLLRYQLLKGLPIGLLFALPVIGIVLTARLWYKRADMVAISSLSPFILLIAIVCITTFVAVFYKRVQWEKREQQYQELLRRHKQENTQVPGSAA